MKVEISQEDLAFVRDLAHELKTQNNRATGAPYYYTIRKKKRVVGMDASYSSETVYVRQDGNDYEDYATEEEAIAQLMKEDMTREEAEKYFEEYFNEFGVYEYDEDQNVFLTYKGLIEHIKLNGHNIGRRIDPDKPWKEDDQIHSYVHHAFRNPEMRRLIEIIEKLGVADATE